MTLEKPITLQLPWPPTLNTYWRSVVMGKGVRVLVSDKGRRYRTEVSKACMIQKAPRRIAGRLAVRIYAEAPDVRARDLDNLPKGLLDSLTNANLWEDDSQIDDLRIVRGPKCGPEGRVTVTISPATLPDELRS